MHLRNVDGMARTASSGAITSRPTAAKTLTNQKDQPTAGSKSRGSFFQMMLSADSAQRAKPSSADGNSTAVRGGSATSQETPAMVRNTINTELTPPPLPPPSTDPVEVLNGLLSKLGYDPSHFNARVTSANISVPGLSYAYPLLEVTVNGEKVGFHLPSVMHDPRVTAANISSMMGKPVMNFGAFA